MKRELQISWYLVMIFVVLTAFLFISSENSITGSVIGILPDDFSVNETVEVNESVIVNETLAKNETLEVNETYVVNETEEEEEIVEKTIEFNEKEVVNKTEVVEEVIEGPPYKELPEITLPEEAPGNLTIQEGNYQTQVTCDVTISACKNNSWIAGNTYCLDTNITNKDGYCMRNLTDVTLDCGGNIIDGDDTGTDVGIEIVSPSSDPSFKNVIIQNCIITDFNDGVHLVDANHTLLQNLTISSNTDDGVEIDSNFGRDIRNFTLRNSIISDNTDEGLNTDFYRDVVIYDNIFRGHSGTSDAGINLIRANAGTTTNISGNNFSDNYYGIFFDQLDNATVEDNIFMNNSRGMFFQATADSNLLLNNVINHSLVYGIEFGNQNGLDQKKVFGNTMNGNDYIHCYDNDTYTASHTVTKDSINTDLGGGNIYLCDNVVLNNVTIDSHRADGYGLYVVESDYLLIENSTFFNNTYGIYLPNTGTDNDNFTLRLSNVSTSTTRGIWALDADNMTLNQNTFEGHSGTNDAAVYFQQTNDYANISHNNFTNNYYGIHDDSTSGSTNNSNNTYSQNRFISNTFAGINMEGDSVSIINNIFLNNARGIFFASTASYNILLNNQINGSTTNAIQFNNYQRFDQLIYGNTIDGYEYIHCYNNDSFYARDIVMDTTLVTNLGAANIYLCDNAVFDNLTFNSYTTGGAYAMHFVASDYAVVDNSTFFGNTYGVYSPNTETDNDNLTIRNSNFTAGTSRGIWALDADNITIYNNSFSDFTGTNDAGIYLQSDSDNGNISANNFTNNYYGIWDDGSTSLNDNVTYSMNFFKFNTYGINVDGDSCTFYQNTFRDNERGIQFQAGAVTSIIYRNNFMNSSTRHVQAGVSNFFNLSNLTGGGNYWDDFDSGGEGCTDGNSDGFCDSPRNSTIDAGFTGQDNHPYISEIVFGVNIAPTQGTPILNTTDPLTNDTNQNLTAYNVSTADVDNDLVRNIYNWFVNGTSLMVLNMPFESINGTTTNNSYDYSGYGNNGTTINPSDNATWNSTGGYDGMGAYEFDGGNDYIPLGDDSSLFIQNISVSAWINMKNLESATSTVQGIIDATGTADQNGYVLYYNEGGNRFEFAVDEDGSGDWKIALSDADATIGKWTHLVGTMDGSFVKLYVDGILQTTAIAATKITYSSSEGKIGKYGSTDIYLFNGTIDEVQIWGRSLSAEQISALYNNRTDLIVSNETNFGENWFVDITPNDGSEDGITERSNNVTILTILPNVAPNVSNVILNTTSTNNVTTDNLTGFVTASDVDNDNITLIYDWYKNGGLNATTLILGNLTAYWPLNNDSLDYFGENNGTLAGAFINSTGGQIGGGAQFDGTNDDIQMANNVSLSPGLGNFTVVAWVKNRGSTGTTQYIYWDSTTSSNRPHLAMYITDSSGKATSSVRDSDGTTISFIGGPEIKGDNLFHQIAQVRNGTTMSLYVDGVLVNTSTDAGLGNLNVETGRIPRIGAGATGADVATLFFNGTIDEVQFYKRALTATEINQLYFGVKFGGNVMNSSQTSKGQNWTLGVKGADSVSIGGQTNSSNITILNTVPTQGTPILNTTDLSTNSTLENLTVYNVSTTDVDGDNVTNIYNWYVNGTSLTVLNMPFEGVNNTAENNTWDYSGYGNIGTENGSVVWNATGGHDGKGSYEFDGSGDFIEIKDTDSLTLTDFSISVWFKSTGSTGDLQTIVHNYDADGEFYDLQLFSNGSLLFQMDDGSNPLGQLTDTSANYMDGIWHHAVGVRNTVQDNLSIYVDGQLKLFGDDETDLTSLDSAETLKIGYQNSDFPREFLGSIDDVKIFNRSLTAQQVLALYENQTDVIVSQETNFGENWFVDITPNDGSEDGITERSNNVTILDVTVPSVSILNPANGTNHSNNEIQAFNASVIDTEAGVKIVIFQISNGSNPFNTSATNVSGNWGATINISNLVESTHTVAVFANDSAGNVNKTENISIIVDRTGATVNLINPSFNTTDTTPSVSFNFTDLSINGICTLYLNSGGLQTDQTVINNTNTIITVALARTEGTFITTVNCTDGAGNIGNSSAISIGIDTAAPSVSIINSSFNTTDSTPSVSFNFTDLSASANCTMYMDSVHVASNSSVVNNSNTILTASTQAEGTFVTTVNCTDNVGRVGNSSAITIIIDQTLPNVNILNPSNGTNLSSGLQAFNASVINGAVGVDTVLFQFSNGSNPFNVTASNSSGNWNVNLNLSRLTETTHVFIIFANDTLNNMNKTENRSVIVDRTGATVNLINTSFNTTDTTPSFSFNFTDLSASANCTMYMNSVHVASSTTANNTNAILTASAQTEGTFVTTVNCTDGSNNIGNSSAITIIIDQTVPQVSILNPSNSTNLSSGLQAFNASVINGAVGVDTVLFQFSNGSNPFNVTATNSSGNWNVNLNLSRLTETTHVFTIFANDTLNNMNKTENRSVIVDRTGATVNLINTSFNTTDTTPSFSFNYTDLAINGICTLYLNSEGLQTDQTVINNTNTIITVALARTEGTFVTTVNCTDGAGNVGNSSAISISIDTAAPSVSTINVSFNTTDTTPSVSFNFTDLSINANCTLYMDSVHVASNSSVVNNSNTILTASTQAEGTFVTTVNCTDNVGRVGNSSAITIIIDQTLPDVNILNPSNGTNHSSGLQAFNASVINGAVGVDTVLFQFSNGSNSFNVTASNSSGNWNVNLNLSRLTETTHVFTIFANDTLNNMNKTENISIIVDRTGATVNIINSSFNTTGTTPSVSFNYTDLSISANCTLYMNSVHVASNYTTTNNTNTILTASAQTEGTFITTVNCTDGSNNVGNSSAITITLTSVSSVTIQFANASNTSANFRQNETFRANVTITSNTSLSHYIFSTNTTGIWQNDTEVSISGLEYNASVNKTINVSAGKEICWYYWANDSSDNTNVSTIYCFEVAVEEEEEVTTTTGAAVGGGGGGSAATPSPECSESIECPTDKYCVNNRCLKIFDLKMLQVDSPIQPGEFLDFTYLVKGMADISGDVIMTFWVERNGQIVTSGSDVIFVGDFEEKIETTNLFLPSDLTIGDYTINVKLQFEGYEIISHRVVQVQKDVDLIFSLNILDLPRIEPELPWEYFAILSANKDQTLPVKIESKIIKNGEIRWFKEGQIVLDRIFKIQENVFGLEEGDYILEVTAKSGDQSVKASQSFIVGEPGVSIFGKDIRSPLEILRDYSFVWTIFAILLALIFLFLVIRKEINRKSMDKLQKMVGKMIRNDYRHSRIKMIIKKKGYKIVHLNIVLNRIHATRNLNREVNLHKKNVRQLRDFISNQRKKGVAVQNIIQDLVKEGWPSQAIQEYVIAYYK
jgi:parallel beta-helix repeat protein